MAKSKPKPMPEADHKLVGRVAAKAKEKGHKHGVAMELLKAPPTVHVVALIDQATARPELAASAQQEGDERLSETLDGVLELCLHAKETCEAHGLPVSDRLAKAIEGLTLAVS